MSTYLFSPIYAVAKLAPVVQYLSFTPIKVGFPVKWEALQILSENV